MNEIDFINVDQSLSLEREFGSGYINVTDSFFSEDTGCYGMKSEILDENHNMLGNLEVNGRLCHFYQDDHKTDVRYYTEINLEGDIKQMDSLFMGI
jgi:hypothetical protein